MEIGLSLALRFGTEGNVKGSGASLSGLVQLPPSDGYDDKLPFESSDESERIEQADIGRLIVSPGFCVLNIPQVSLKWFRCVDGVRGEVMKRRGGMGERYPSAGSVYRCWKIGRNVSTVAGVSIVGMGISIDSKASL